MEIYCFKESTSWSSSPSLRGEPPLLKGELLLGSKPWDCLRAEEWSDSLRGEEALAGEEALKPEDSLRGEECLMGEENLAAVLVAEWVLPALDCLKGESP